MSTSVDKLQFYHSSSKDLLADSWPAFSYGTAVWETCLRKIIFVAADESKTLTSEHLQVNQNLHFYEGASALDFLLTVLCGLDSKVVGETEIFWQFKNFVQTTEAQKNLFFRNPKTIQFLFQEVKALRETHLKGLGVHSYGSLIRKMSKDLDRVCVIGHGHLAEEVIPWFKNKNIDVHVRSPEKYSRVAGREFYRLGHQRMAPLVVIAAPIDTADLLVYFKEHGSGIQQVIDCRSLSREQTSLIDHATYSVVELKDLFDLLAGQQDKIRKALPAIRAEISLRVQDYMLKSQHRPMGWEDLC